MSTGNRSNGRSGRDAAALARAELPKLFDRTPPVNLEAEAALLGSMILDWRVIGDVVQVIKGPEDFHKPGHTVIYDAIVGIWSDKQSLDIVELKTRLDNTGQLEGVGGVESLIELAESVPSASSAVYYAEMVRQNARIRELIDALGMSLYECYHPGAKVDEVFDRVESRVFRICERSQPAESVKLASVLQETFDRLEAEDGRTVTGVETGFADLDEMLNGLQPGDLVIVAARPSMGKTAFALNMAEHIAATGQRPVAFYSLEMSRQQIGQRMLCARSGINSHRVRRNMLTSDEFAKLSLTVGELSEAPLHINDRAGLTLMQLRADARRMASRHKVECIFIDYLQLMTAPGAESRQVEVSNLSRGIKALARELNVPVVCLSQLNRQSAQREGHRPRMSELRESGCLTGDTLITMADTGQRIPIAELVGRSGFRVWARTDEGIQAAICSRAFSTGVKPVFAMTTATGKTIRATANHRFLSRNGWRRLDQLKPGDAIACYAHTPEPRHAADMADDDLLLLGHMIGNGSVLRRHAAQYTTRHFDLAKEVKALALRLFKGEIAPHIVYSNPRRQVGWYQLFFKSLRRHTHGVRSVVSEWAEAHGLYDKRSHERRIPDAAMAQSSRAITKLLTGLWETDGTICLANHPKGLRASCHYSTSSEVLAHQVQYLLARIGVIAGVSRIRQGRHRPCYLVQARGGREGIAALLAKLDFSSAFHRNLKAQIQTHLGTLCGESTTTMRSVSGITYERIRHIKSAGMAECYDLTVPGPANMEANMIVAHNSIEQDADVVMLLHREDYYHRGDEDYHPTNTAEVIVEKQRMGDTGVVRLVWDGPATRFRNMANQNESGMFT